MPRVLSHRAAVVIEYLEKYCDLVQAAINEAYKEIPDHAATVKVVWGTKYYKVIKEGQYQKSVHAFIDRETGTLYKPASFDAPSKTTNYNIVDDYKKLVKEVDPYGAYLYKKNPFKK